LHCPPARPQEEDEEEEEDFAGGGRGGSVRTAMPLKKRMALSAGGASAAGGADSSEEEEEEAIEDDGYGSDYMGDDEDRERLAALPELEREQILFQRSEARQDMEEKRRVAGAAKQARRREREQAAAAAAPAGRKGKAGPRTRAPTAKKTAKDAALDELKARTAMKAASRTEARAEAARRREEAAARRAEAGGTDSDASASARSDDDDDDGRRGDGRRRRGARGGEDDDERGGGEAEEDEEPAPFAVIMRCCLTRLQLEKWADKPFFDDTVAGCFVRVGTGPGSGGVAQYRMAEVVRVLNGEHRGSELSSYAFGPGGRRTSKWLLLRHGETERAFKMAMVSNSAVGENEWRSWAQAAQRAERRPLTVSEVSTREAAIKAASEYRWASADVARALAEKRAANAAPRNVALEKELLSSRLEVALQAGDEDEVAQCQAALAECETALASLPRGGAAMTNINKRNATANVAILDVAAREAATLASGRAAGTMAKGSDVDPFSRRPTRVTNYWQTKAKTEAGKEADGGDGDAAAQGKEAPAEAAPVGGSAAVADGEPPAAAAADGGAGAAAGDGDEEVALRARDDDDTHALAAAHLAAWQPIDISRCAGARTLPLLRTWRGGLNAAEEAIRSGKTLISVADYYKRRAAQ
jgi:RNA polymerase-associated protein RTF1